MSGFATKAQTKETNLNGVCGNLVRMKEQASSLIEQLVVIIAKPSIGGNHAVDQRQDRCLGVLWSNQVLRKPLTATWAKGTDGGGHLHRRRPFGDGLPESQGDSRCAGKFGRMTIVAKVFPALGLATNEELQKQIKHHDPGSIVRPERAPCRLAREDLGGLSQRCFWDRIWASHGLCKRRNGVFLIIEPERWTAGIRVRMNIDTLSAERLANGRRLALGKFADSKRFSELVASQGEEPASAHPHSTRDLHCRFFECHLRPSARLACIQAMFDVTSREPTEID
jgi:hypothetical protein